MALTVVDLLEMKNRGQKISMVTCYDFWSAQIVNQSPVDCVLVGDSLAMIEHGYATTIPADSDMMALHVRAVASGAPDKFVIGDMPFLSVRSGLRAAMENVGKLMKAGGQAVKVEGIDGHAEIIRHISESGVPVMGHLGLTPQSVHQFGGFRVQGKGTHEMEKLREQALRVQDAGCFSLVLECVRTSVAEKITEELDIPVIGIGAGPSTDGQVLVLHDMLDLFPNVSPKFVRKYGKGTDLFLKALSDYDRDVKSGSFPSERESYE